MRPLRARNRGERGALTPAVIVMAIGLLLLGGLVTDGGRQLNAKLRAQATAEEAARAGAAMIDQRFGETEERFAAVLDRDKAVDAVTEYCRTAMEQDPSISKCEPGDFGRDEEKAVEWIEVNVEIDVKPLLFGMIGMDNLHAEASAQASPVQAVLDPYHERAGNNPIPPPTPEYPTVTVSVTTTTGTEATSVPLPTGYTTHLCGTVTVLPPTVGMSCSVTTSTHTPPPPPAATETTTVFTPYPTSVSPSF